MMILKLSYETKWLFRALRQDGTIADNSIDAYNITHYSYYLRIIAKLHISFMV